MPALAQALSTAIALQQSRRWDEAEAIYRDLLAAEPTQPNALYLYGVLSLGTGRAGQAVALLEQAVALRPDHAEGRFALANARLRQGQPAAAIDLYRQVLGMHPDHAGATINLAAALREAGDAAAAVAVAREGLARQPGLAPLHTALAAALLASGSGLPTPETTQALDAARLALALDPNAAEALFVGGTALRALGRAEEALPLLRQAVALDPAHARARLNLGNTLADLDRLEEALEACRAAIALEPSLVEAHASLGYLLTCTHQLDAAIAACETAISLKPDDAQAHWNQGIAHLLAGNYEAGWAKYEWRKRHALYARQHQLAGPTWEGEDLHGRTLLVHAEQGLGDTIQFARFLPRLAERGARVVLACSPLLFPVLEGVPGIAALASKDAPLPPYDLWVDQMSLPRLFGTTLDTIPAAPAYLRAHPSRAAHWHARLPAGPRVGLAWAGNPAHSNDRHRSMPPEALAPILAVPGVTFVLLQVARRGGLPGSTTPVLDLADRLTDFRETAAVIANLDRVISVDTSVAHLAGALGCPTWVMLPYAPDWRWVLGRDDTPWYPAMRLFRQQQPGDWATVAARVAEGLRAALRPDDPAAQQIVS